MRYALLTMKVSLVYLLLRHRVVRCDKTAEELVLDHSKHLSGGFVNIEKRDI